MTIPLSAPSITDEERDAVLDSLESGELAGDRNYTRKATELLEETFNIDNALLTPSCTHALELASLLLGVDESDEVLVPSYTFPATATPFLLRGATIRFVDIKQSTLNMNPVDLREKISDDTAAVVPVDYAGVGCAIDEIIDIAHEHGAKVVQDAAQGVDAKYKDQFLGTQPSFGAYSFHNTKNYTAGEGGALLVNDEKYLERAEYIRQNGTNYTKFQRGEIDTYEWVDIGSSYVISDLLAALLSAQLKRRDEIRKQRKEIHQRYDRELEGLEEDNMLRRPVIPDGRRPNYHLYYVLVGDERTRDKLASYLEEHGITAAQHYEPLHTSRMGTKIGNEQKLPVTENIAPRLLRLPIHTEMTVEDAGDIADHITAFFEQA